MNLTELIESALKENGYDGLCNVALECGCQIGDLFPCGDLMPGCVGGYQSTDKDGNWIIVAENREWT